MRKIKQFTSRMVAVMLAGILAMGSLSVSAFGAEEAGSTGAAAEEISFDEPAESNMAAETASELADGEVMTESSSAETVDGEGVTQSTSEEAAEGDVSELPDSAFTDTSGTAAEEAAVTSYTVTLDANGGYFANEWDDVIGDYVEQAEVVVKQIPVGEIVTAVPVNTDQEGHSLVFLGWSLVKNGEPITSGNEEYAPVESCVLYAAWKNDKSTANTEAVPWGEAEEIVNENTPPSETVQEAKVVEELEMGLAGNEASEEVSVEDDIDSDHLEFPVTENEQIILADQDALYIEENVEETNDNSLDWAEAEEEAGPDSIESTESEVEICSEEAVRGIVATGTCGENLTWAIDEDETLTISGTGEMTTWDSDFDLYFNRCKKLIINNGVTSISEGAFTSCPLESVVISDSVVSIGREAFRDRGSLTSVTIPNSVTSIGDSAFSGCLSLASVTIPNSVTSIEDSTFSGCSNLTSVTIPDSVTSIGDAAFYHCDSLTSVTIPETVTSIGDSAFADCISLASVTIPKGVTSIGDATFQRCNLTSVTIPDSVTSIGDSAFWGCNLTSVTIPDSVTSIGDEAFYDNDFTSVTISKNVTSIGNSAFYNSGSFTSVTIPENVKSIGMKAFLGCKNLSNVTIPGDVAFIADDAFYFSLTSNITSLTVYGNVTSKGLSKFQTCHSLKSVIIQDGVESIGDSAFSYFSNVTNVTIPNSVKSIGDSAFIGCTGLTSLTIPNSVISIGDSAFSGCTGLPGLTIPNSVISIGNGALSNCSSLASVTIPSSVTSIGDYAFSNCSKLTSVTIPSSVTSIGDHAFCDCTSLTSIIIQYGVSSIGNRAFSGCTGLPSLTIPNSVISIGNGALSNCSSLASVTIPSSVTSIGDYAFSNCSKLTSVTIPSSVTSIGDHAFCDCTSLTSIIIQYGVSSIGKFAFSDCTGLSSLIIPNSVISIESSAFYDCSNLKDIYYGAGEEDWNNIFKGSLSGVTIHYNSTGPTEPIEPSEALNEILPTFELSTDTISFKNNSIGDELRLTLKAKNMPLDENSGNLTQEQKDSLCFHVTSIDFEINGTPVAYFMKNGDIYTQKKSIVPLDNGLDIPVNEEKQLADFEILTNPPVIIDSPTQVAKISFTMKGTVNGNSLEVKDEKTVTFLYDFFDDTEYIDLTDDFNDGMLNSLAYLMDNGNFPAATFAMADENDTGSQVVKDVTDLLYRGWDGRKELIWGELSTEDAQQILIDLINDIDVEVKGYAEANTAREFADTLTEGFKGWCLLKGNKLAAESGIKDIIQNIDLDVTNKQIQELLKNGKFDTIAALAWDDDENGQKLSNLFIKYCNSLQNAEKFSKVLKGFGTGSKILSLGMGTVQNFYDLKSLAAADEMYLKMLLYLRDHCSYKPVSTAAGNLYKIIDDETKKVGYLFKDITEEASGQLIGVGVEACTRLLSTQIGIAEKKLMFLAAAKYGYQTGVFLSNTILHTSDSQALKDRLHSLSHIGLSLSKWVADAQRVYFASSGSEKKENMRNVAYGQYMLLKTRMLGEKTYQRLLEMYHQNSLESYRVSVFISSVLVGQEEYLAENGLFLKMKGIGVFCPVELDLIDENNNVLVTVSDGQEMSARKGDVFYWAYYNPSKNDYSKVILYPQDKNYSIRIKGNDTGSVTALYAEFDDAGAAKCLSMTDVKVDNQTVISLDNISVSSEFYTVTDSGNTYKSKLESTIQRELLSYSTPTESCIHDFGDWSILRQATAFANGKKVQYCKKCGFENLEDIEKTENANAGTCGDNLVWTLDKEGTLRIFGTGDIYDYKMTNPDRAPWLSYDIKSVIIEKGITRIGDYAFYSCDFSSVTIPEGVTAIGNNAFSGCLNLTSVTIPEGVTSIESSAFTSCSGLSNLVIPDGVTEIEDFAFSDCSSLTEITIPGSVTKVGFSVFQNCTGLKNVTIDEGVQNLNWWVFNGCKNLEAIKIPSSVETIGLFTFLDCNRLTDITVDSKNANFSAVDGVLFNKNQTKLICYPAGKGDTYTIPDSVTSIETGAFSDCTGLKSLTVGSGNTSFSSIDGVLFNKNCTELICYPAGREGSYSVPEGVTTLRMYSFSGCNNLKEILITKDVTTIGSSAFYNCPNLSIAYFTGVQEEWEAIEIGNSNTDLTDAELVFVDNINSLRYAELSGLSASEYTGKAIEPEPVVRRLGKVLEKGKDYTVSYFNNVNAGTATVKITGIGDNVDSVTATFTITPASISKAVVTGLAAKTYTGKAITQTPVVKLDSSTLTQNTDYTVSFKNNVKAGTATVTITGKGNYTGTRTETFKINRATIAKAKVTCPASKVWAGWALTPVPTVKVGAMTLKKGTDFSLAFKNNKNVGTATITITGKGNYTGTVRKTFKINPKPTSISKLTGGSKKFTVNWKKQASQTSGYQIQYSSRKDFKTQKIVTVSGAGKTSRTLSGLAKKHKYYVRIRTYKTIGKARYYSTWSAAKTVTTK